MTSKSSKSLFRWLAPIATVLAVTLTPAAAGADGIGVGNAAPTVSVDSIGTVADSSGTVWTPTSTDVVVTFTTTDENTLKGTRYTVCFFLSTQDCDDPANAWGIAKFTLRYLNPTTMWIASTPGTGGTNGTWGRVRNVAILDGTRDDTEAQIEATVRVGAIARATVDGSVWADGSTVNWNVKVTADDGDATASDTSANAEVEQYLTMVNGIDTVNYATTLPNASSTSQSRTVTRIKSNDDWKFQVRIPTGWMTGRARILLDNDGTDDGALASNRFAVRCTEGNPAVGGQWLDSTARDITDAYGSAFTTDTPINQSYSCRYYLGAIPQGAYRTNYQLTLVNGTPD